MIMTSIFERIYPVLRGLWVYRWLAVGVAWLVCVSGWIGVALLPSRYVSSARVYVNADPILTPLLKGLAADTDPTRQVDYMRHTLLSRPNLEEAARLVGFDLGNPKQRDILLDHLAATLRIDPITPNLLAISYEDPSSLVANNVVRSLLTVFADKTAGTSRNEMDTAERFLDNEIASYQAKLRDIDARRAALSGQYPDLFPIAKNGNRLDQMRGQITQLGFQLSDATERRDALRKELAAVPPMLSVEQAAQVVIDAAGGPDSIEKRLADARKRLEGLLARYTEAYPDVIATRREVARLEVEAKQPAPRAPAGAAPGKGQIANPVYNQLKVNLVDAETTVASLRHKLADSRAEQARIEAAVKAAPGVQLKAGDLDRDYAVLKSAYDGLVQRRQAAQIADAANTQTDAIEFRIVDPPDVPVLPASPNRLLFNTAVLFFGLGAGVAAPVVLLQFDRSVATIEQLRSFGLPVLGSVSRLTGAAARRTAARQLAGVGVGTCLLLAVYGVLLAAGAFI